jgi:voltage-gated potassium channel
MTDSAGMRAETPAQAQPPLSKIIWSLLRAVGSTAALVAVYYLLPLDHSSVRFGVITLIVGLVILLLLITFQVRAIIASPWPGLRALEALSISVPLFLLLFASTYVVMAARTASTFNAPMTHSNGLYFTVTVFSTVGFGDITAQSQAARLLVTVQMMTDLLILGLGARVILGAVTRGRERRTGSLQARGDAPVRASRGRRLRNHPQIPGA